jgi:hypothetical protein
MRIGMHDVLICGNMQSGVRFFQFTGKNWRIYVAKGTPTVPLRSQFVAKLDFHK